jgi:hypothetical protein
MNKWLGLGLSVVGLVCFWVTTDYKPGWFPWFAHFIYLPGLTLTGLWIAIRGWYRDLQRANAESDQLSRER